jgi:hypothetical protein
MFRGEALAQPLGVVGIVVLPVAGASQLEHG